ncbi:unnamed protein product [Cunninghamella blakesleeana]
MTKEQYICQRAATAIISEIGPYKISSDALQSINQFLDEVLFLLLKYANSLDFSIIKAQVLSLLPLSLGKNAIVEAELEVKTYTETNVIDYSLYENLKKINPSIISLDQLYTILRHQCIECCTLADKATSTNNNNSNNNNSNNITISPMVVIYITTVLEHMAEYILTTTAVTAENENTEYVRNKEVYIALLDDVQVGELFRQTEIRMKLEKRVITYQSQHQYQSMTLPSPAPSPIASYNNKQSASHHDLYDRTSDPYIDYSQENLEDDTNSEPLPSSTHTRSSFSIKSGQSSHYRPVSVLSNATTGTVKSTSSSKKGFRLFGKKDKRSSTASQATITMQQRPTSPTPSSATVQVYDPDAPALDFEDLIRSGNTMKVSLTPTRLRSIEVKSNQYDHENYSNKYNTSSSSPNTIPYPNSMKSPTSSNNIIPFENPRAAPKPPIHHHQQQHSSASTLSSSSSSSIVQNNNSNNKQTPPLTPNSSVASRLSNSRSPPPPPTSFEDNDENTNHIQKTVNGKHIKQPPAPLQLNGSSSKQRSSSSLQQSYSYENIMSDSEDAYITDLPSPPTTTGYRSSISNFSVSSENGKQQSSNNPRSSNEIMVTSPSAMSMTNKPRFPRPSSMVAKRASSSSRPTSFHESFALSMEHHNQGDLAMIQALTSPGLSSSSSSDQYNGNPLTFPIGSNHVRSSTPPPSSSTGSSSNTSTTTNTNNTNSSPATITDVTTKKTIIRRRTARPMSQLITIEDEQEPKVEESKSSSSITTTTTTSSSHHTGDNDKKKIVEEDEENEEEEDQNKEENNKVIEDEKEINDNDDHLKAVALEKSIHMDSKFMNRQSIRNLATLLADDATFYNSSNTSYDRRDRILQILHQHQSVKNNNNNQNQNNKKKTNYEKVNSSMQTDPIPGLPPLSSILSSSSSSSPSASTAVVPDVMITKMLNDSSISDFNDNDSLMKQQPSDINSSSSEKGMIDGDEEWFMEDEDWEDTQEQDTMMAEWLLGES